MDSTNTVQYCRNCGARIRSEYCADCGQREGRADRRFFDTASDLAGDLFDADSRFWRTLFPLMVRPGFLTAEFFAGRRARYLPPLRLYLVLSFLLFLAMSMVAPKPSDQGVFVVNNDGENEEVISEDDPPELPNYLDPDSSWINITMEDSPQWLQDIEDRMNKNTGKLKDDPQRFVDLLLDYAPQLMFALLPLFALLIQFVYLFSPYHYLQHLVFALHYHSFVYLLYLIDLGLERVIPAASSWLWLVLLAYLPLALRRAYGSGWMGAVGKSALIYFTYGIAMALGIAATAMVALWLL